jgi:hypothetical protein
VFWTEPVPTLDLDVLVLLPSPESALVSLDRIYRWAESRGYAAEERARCFWSCPPWTAGSWMRSLSDMASRPDGRVEGLPSEALLKQLREGKAALHERHSSLTLPEKVRLVMELQRIVLPLIARRRPLRSWERAWDIEP